MTKKLFDETDVYILTLGLSEVWHDEQTGGVFWRTIPKDAFDPARHKFRVSTVDENRDNLAAIQALIRKHRPDAKIVLTLSPIPLAATFRNVSCVSANTKMLLPRRKGSRYIRRGTSITSFSSSPE